jgi:hypothetical protein
MLTTNTHSPTVHHLHKTPSNAVSFHSAQSNSRLRIALSNDVNLVKGQTMVSTQKDTSFKPMVLSLKRHPKNHERASGEFLGLRPSAQIYHLYPKAPRLEQLVYILCLHHDDHPPLGLSTTVFLSPYSPLSLQQNTTSPSGRSSAKIQALPMAALTPTKACVRVMGDLCIVILASVLAFRIGHGSCILNLRSRKLISFGFNTG